MKLIRTAHLSRDADDYILTYKSKGLMMREEHNLPLTEEAYCHLREKADGRIITKERYCIPYEDHLTIELDVFAGDLSPLLLAEVEFSSEEEANAPSGTFATTFFLLVFQTKSVMDCNQCTVCIFFIDQNRDTDL